MLRFPSAALVLAALAAGTALAQDPGAADAAACARVGDDAARLACYDALFRGVPARPAAAAAPRVAPTPEQKLEDFGLSQHQREARGDSPAELPLEEIASRVAAVENPGPGVEILVLENGQRWRIVSGADALGFRAGDALTIRRATFGSFMAYPEGRKGAYRVRRID